MERLSEVRPEVLEMPKAGFYLKTGGSAKRRIVKPLLNQKATTSFPINTTYKVTGVPGHTHSSSAVLSLTVDLKRNRGSDQKIPEEWAGRLLSATPEYLGIFKQLFRPMSTAFRTKIVKCC